MCKVLGVSEKQYYQWRIQEEHRNGRRLEERELVQRVEEAFHASDDAYGCRKITRELRNEGIGVSEWKVRRIMREHGLYSVTQKKYRPFRHHQEKNPYKQDLVKQQFRPEGPNIVWAGDITYIKTKIGWVYLAIVMDLYNREVIGYATSQKIDTELVKRALGEAVGRYPETEGTIFHSDRGTQYTSTGYQNALTSYKMLGSMSRGGCPYDNSCVESFFAQLKKERIYRRRYRDLSEVNADLFDYIELFYNRKRIHSTLNYQTPIGYRFSNGPLFCGI
jgi:transposase InsO family protein